MPHALPVVSASSSHLSRKKDLGRDCIVMQKEGARERITHACLELLNTTSLESLRAQDIMVKAGVSRSTFYRLFLDKYEVVNWVYQKQVEEIIRDMPDLKSWKEWTFIIHDYMREHKQFFRNIASYRGQNSFEEFLCNYFMGNVKRTSGHIIEKMTGEQQYAVYAFSLVGAHATVDWILNGFQPDDATLLRLLDACIPSCIRMLYE